MNAIYTKFKFGGNNFENFERAVDDSQLLLSWFIMWWLLTTLKIPKVKVEIFRKINFSRIFKKVVFLRRKKKKRCAKEKVGKCYSCCRDFLASPEFFGRRAAVQGFWWWEGKDSQPLLFRWQSNSERATVQSRVWTIPTNIFSVSVLFVCLSVTYNSVQVSLSLFKTFRASGWIHSLAVSFNVTTKPEEGISCIQRTNIQTIQKRLAHLFLSRRRYPHHIPNNNNNEVLIHSCWAAGFCCCFRQCVCVSICADIWNWSGIPSKTGRLQLLRDPFIQTVDNNKSPTKRRN